MNFFLGRSNATHIADSRPPKELFYLVSTITAQIKYEKDYKKYVIEHLPEHSPKSLRRLKLTIVTSIRL